ncbi:hypothetical protein CEXT_281591 [Caerostris extrusa]|uniref:Uncharacterized protein n=1 Tax=Caerostris extrusa TaxID=172846 RepID=A0AAV4MU06_CAEEX|nr:hypothetical protein CEXT_281591 [Caerostris extrusa]
MSYALYTVHTLPLSNDLTSCAHETEDSYQIVLTAGFGVTTPSDISIGSKGNSYELPLGFDTDFRIMASRRISLAQNELLRGHYYECSFSVIDSPTLLARAESSEIRTGCRMCTPWKMDVCLTKLVSRLNFLRACIQFTGADEQNSEIVVKAVFVVKNKHGEIFNPQRDFGPNSTETVLRPPYYRRCYLYELSSLPDDEIHFHLQVKIEDGCTS